MKFVRYSLIAVAATAFSLAAYLTYQAETKPEEITIKVTPYSQLESAPKSGTQSTEATQRMTAPLKVMTTLLVFITSSKSAIRLARFFLHGVCRTKRRRSFLKLT